MATQALFRKLPGGNLAPADSWVPLLGYEGLYEIQRSGRIRSVTRKVTTKGGWVQRHNGTELKPRPKSNGYLIVDLNKDGKKVTRHLHRLLALQFIPNPEAKPCINHIDSNKTNNCLDNLEWCDYRENWEHAHKNGKIPPCTIGKGENSQSNKLNNKQVKDIKLRLANGEAARALAREYQVSSGTVDFIKAGKTWSHIII